MTQTHRKQIFYALAAFVAAKGRLPFPSNSQGASPWGEENPKYPLGSSMEGIVPFKTLGLSETFARNGAHNFFIYVVHPQLTFTKTPREYCEKEIHHLLSVKSDKILPFDPVSVVLISPPKGRGGKHAFL